MMNPVFRCIAAPLTVLAVSLATTAHAAVDVNASDVTQREVDRQAAVAQIQDEIEQRRQDLERDRVETDHRRSLSDPAEAERLRLAFEERREVFEHWREDKEHERQAIESGS